ncbi:MAG: glycosyltransferase [Methylococcaceae bacterium]
MNIVLFLPTFGDGGIERNFVYLANGLVQSGHRVSLLVPDPQGSFMEQLHETVECVAFSATGKAAWVDFLLQFIQARRPDAVLTGQADDHRMAATVRQRLGGSERCCFYAFVGTPLLHMAEQRYRFPPALWLKRLKLARLMRDQPRLLANSQGVALDLSRLTGRPLTDIAVVPNPTIPPQLDELAGVALHHPWLQDPDIPVIMGAGRMSRAKDFPTLIKAFARVHQARPARLMLLGAGHQADTLKSLAASLGIAQAVDWPGFVTNPYAYLARAAVFVLSSRWEGCPNVLIEALAVGTPVVATDCISGPSEVLQQGRYGRLVPVGDDQAMSAAILATLDAPLPSSELRQAAKPYHIRNATQAFITLLESSHV